ncbi:MAG TPA: type II secretion system protein [Patescibacteria group bacterium]|nr:type II secretion system protein [Patescibacteria group bacterium]
MRNKAFTLIELLVVISIIGVLIGLSIFGIEGARKSSRDARRKADLELIRSGLEIYRSDCDKYPASLSWGGNLSGDDSVAGCLSTNEYISLIPTDPVSTNSYAYSGVTTTYILCASLEQGGGAVSGCGDCGESACNYKVENP